MDELGGRLSGDGRRVTLRAGLEAGNDVPEEPVEGTTGKPAEEEAEFCSKFEQM